MNDSTTQPLDGDTPRTDAGYLWHALKDLSFDCDGVTQTQAPTRGTYNATFAVCQSLASKYQTHEHYQKRVAGQAIAQESLRPRAMLLSPMYMTISNAAEVLDYAEKLEAELAAANTAKVALAKAYLAERGELLRQKERAEKAEQSLAALQSEVADFKKSDEILSKQNHQLRTLIELIFASTLPYNDGEPTFSDKVTDAYHALFPNAKEPV